MKTEEKVINALISLKEGDRFFNEDNYEKSIASYEKALKLSKSIPANELFDHPGFEASCQAGLSGSFGRLGRHQESLQASEAALVFYDRFGDMYLAETGKWMMATVNKGSALAMLGNLKEALEIFNHAKEMLSKRNMNTLENQVWIQMLDQNFETVKDLLKNAKKSWWKR